MSAEVKTAVVPVEPTLEMQKAYFDVIDRNLARVETDPCFGRFASQKQAYAAMLAAAPALPVSAEDVARVIDPLVFDLTDALDNAENEPEQLRTDATALRDARLAKVMEKANAIIALIRPLDKQS